MVNHPGGVADEGERDRAQAYGDFASRAKTSPLAGENFQPVVRCIERV